MKARLPVCRIRITLGDDVREELVEKSAFTIGRGRDADIQIASPNISRIHLTVEIREGAIWVADFGSSNGSFINSKEIARHQAVQYKAGEVIKLGEAKELFTLELRETIAVAHSSVSSASPNEINLDDTQPEIELAPPKIQPLPKAAVVASIDHAAAERILNQARALAEQLRDAAEIDAKKILGDAKTVAKTLVDDAVLESQKTQKDAEVRAVQFLKDAEEGTKDKVTEIYRKANAAGDQILAEYKPRAEKLVGDARQQAALIKTTAQEEADKLLKETYQKCTSVQISAEEKANQTEKEAHQKSELILKGAQTEVDQILRDAQKSSRKMRQNNEQDLSEIKLQSEKQAQKRLEQAKLESDKILAQATELGESQKQSVISKGHEEAKEIVNEAKRKAKLSAQEISRGFQDEHVKLGQIRETLERDITRFGLQRIEAEKLSVTANDELSSAKVKLDEIKKHLSETEIACKQRVSELQFQVASLDEAAATKTKALEALELRANEALEKRHIDEEEALQLRNESTALKKNIFDQQAQEAQLVNRLTSLDKQIELERSRLKENLDSDMSVLRKEVTADIKKMRDQANVDHAKSRASQDAELANLRNKELDLIKSLRGEADAKAKLARRHQAIEMARALEIYLTPKLQDALKTQDLPAEHFQTFFKDITTVVTNLLVDDSPSGADAGQIMSPTASIADFTNAKKRKKLFMKVSAATITLLGILFYFQDKYGDHRSASELFAEELREKEAKKPKFTPTITNDYKSSYTDNVIFTDSYAQFKSDSQKQSRWIKDLNKFFINDLNLTENSVVKFIPLESELVSQLQEKRKIIHFESQNDDIKNMRDLEQASVDKLTKVLGGEENYQAFRKFEKNYFQQNRMPASN